MISTNYDSLLEKAQTASNVRLPEMAYIYLASIMIGQGHDLAGRHGIKVKSKGDRDIFSTLSFKGVLPEEITRDCLSVISARDELVHAFDKVVQPSDKHLRHLLQRCKQLEELS